MSCSSAPKRDRDRDGVVMNRVVSLDPVVFNYDLKNGRGESKEVRKEGNEVWRCAFGNIHYKESAA